MLRISRLTRFSHTFSLAQQPQRVHRDRNVKVPEKITLRGSTYKTSQNQYNLTQNVIDLVERGGYHDNHFHPIGLLCACIQKHFNETYRKQYNRITPDFAIMTHFDPVVTTHQQFDSMLIPQDHISRSKVDNYYVNDGLVLRAHTSAHQEELLKSGIDRFLVFGDVYRRDEIDSTHYPAFHQMEGVKLFNDFQLPSKGEFESDRCENLQANYSQMDTDFLVYDMQKTIIGLFKALLGDDIKYRWNTDYFPFTHPSYELEIFYNDQWVELLGCGIVEDQILKNAGVSNKKGWACGIGIERLAMLMFKIEDIRQLWTSDPISVKSYENLIQNLYAEMGEDVLKTFDNGNKYINPHKIEIEKIRSFRMPSYTKVPGLVQNVSFFKLDDSVSPIDVYDIIRDVSGELIESVTLKNTFMHPKRELESQTYEMIFRPTGNKPLSKKEVHKLAVEIKQRLLDELNIEKRW